MKKNIIEKNLFGEQPDKSVIDAAKAEMQASQSYAKKNAPAKRKAVIGACACLILCVIVVCATIPAWRGANSSDPNYIPQKKQEVVDIEDYCRENGVEINFLASNDAVYNATVSEKDDSLMYITQEGTTEGASFVLKYTLLAYLETATDDGKTPADVQSFKYNDYTVYYYIENDAYVANIYTEAGKYNVRLKNVDEESFKRIIKNILL